MQNTRWVVITIVDILTEVAAWSLIFKITFAVNMSLPRKCQVVLAFSFRLLLVILSGLHLKYFSDYTTSPEPQFAITNALLLQQVTIVWSIISATIPNLKNFLKSFSLGMGFPVAFDISGYGSSHAYALQNMSHGRSKITASQAVGAASSAVSRNDDRCRDRPGAWRPDETGHQSTVVHQGHRGTQGSEEEDKISRHGSQEMIINKEVVWNVTYEGNR